MINNKRIVGVILARGGSKGLPGKNIIDLGGKPLIAWTVAAAQKSRYLDRLILSSDNRAIIAAARKAGCEAPFVRPARLATDTASSYDVLFHALDSLDCSYDYVVLLQPTSPLRTAEDIDACIELCLKRKAPAAVSVCVVVKPPQWMYALTADGRLKPILQTKRPSARRQDLTPIYALNGAVYVAKTAWLRRHKTFFGSRTAAHIMPPERSIDIDTKLDLMFARALVAEKHRYR